MITEDKVTELFCIADDFCKFFDAMMEKYTIKETKKRNYHRDSTLSKTEVMLIMILFHDSGYRCLKHFYLESVCKHMRHLFPRVVSYNRFVELERDVAVPLALFVKKVLLGKCTGVSFVDSTPLRVCRNQRIHMHKVFRGIAQRGKCSMGWFFGFKLHLICNEKGELLNFMITPGDVDDRKPLEYKAFVEFIYGKLVADKGYIGKNLFERLFVDGIQLITKFPSPICLISSDLPASTRTTTRSSTRTCRKTWRSVSKLTKTTRNKGKFSDKAPLLCHTMPSTV